MRRTVVGLALAAASPAMSQPNAIATSAAATIIPAAGGIATMAYLMNSDAESAGGTVLGGVLLWGGLVLGPSAGYAANGRMDGAKRGLLIRGVTFVAVSLIAPTTDWNDGIYPNPELDTAGLWVIAIPTILSSDVIDIWKASRRVHTPRASRVSVVPWRGQAGSPGVRVDISF